MPPGLPRALAALTGAALLGTLVAAPPSLADDHDGERPRGGGSSRVAVFPSDSLTVADPAQATGRRVALPLPDCSAFPSDCDEVRLVNQLDGFDLDPRIAVTFDRPVDAGSVRGSDVQVVKAGTTEAIPTERFVWDAASTTLFAHPSRLLEPGTRYYLVVSPRLSGTPGGSVFTTTSANRQLLQIREQLDDGSAYAAAGIPAADRDLDFTGPDGRRLVFPAATTAKIDRTDDRGAQQVTSTVLNSALAGAGAYAFGTFEAPSWLSADRVIPATPTGSGEPAVTGAETVGVALVLPAGPAPAGGWPVAIFGHGFTRSKLDLFLAADLNAARGIATLAMDVPGHGYGDGSTISVTSATAPLSPVAFPAQGRGFDQDGDGTIGNTEGVSAPSQPHPLATIGNRDGLRQTVADLLTLVRAVERGVDVDGDGATDLRPDDVAYYGQSFGGIYGTMLTAVDPQVPVGALNVPGGPIIEIARLGAFRFLTTEQLERRVPSLLNGGRDGFTESLPLRLDPPVTDPAPGALPIQAAFERTAWLARSGSPEAFAPLLRQRPPAGSAAKSVLYQVAYGDETVPNPTSATLVRAGGLQDVTTVYRNDRTPTASSDPHSFLLNPALTGRQQGQVQIAEFLASGGTRIVDPDGPAPVFEVPVADLDSLETLNYTP